MKRKRPGSYENWRQIAQVITTSGKLAEIRLTMRTKRNSHLAAYLSEIP